MSKNVYFKYTICEQGPGGFCKVHGCNGGLLDHGERRLNTTDVRKAKAEARAAFEKYLENPEPHEASEMMRLVEFKDGYVRHEYLLLGRSKHWKRSY